MSKKSQGKLVMDALRKISKEKKGSSINELRLVVALERAIARMEHHPKLSSHIIFKGGFVLMKTVESIRFTRDVDSLARGISRAEVPALVSEALTHDLDDGLWFGDIAVEDLENQGFYRGYRFNCAFQIGEAQEKSDPKVKKFSRIHIDMGFGDPVDFPSEKQTMISVLPGSQPVTWSIYPLEYIFAEKLEALFSRGSANSRAKDIYDLPLIFLKCKKIDALMSAIRRTFNHRETELPSSFLARAKAFDLTIMRGAWPSVELTVGRKSFEDTWKELLVVLKKIDSIEKIK